MRPDEQGCSSSRELVRDRKEFCLFFLQKRADKNPSDVIKVFENTYKIFVEIGDVRLKVDIVFFLNMAEWVRREVSGWSKFLKMELWKLKKVIFSNNTLHWYLISFWFVILIKSKFREEVNRRRDDHMNATFLQLLSASVESELRRNIHLAITDFNYQLTSVIKQYNDQRRPEQGCVSHRHAAGSIYYNQNHQDKILWERNNKVNYKADESELNDYDFLWYWNRDKIPKLCCALEFSVLW